MRGGRVLESGRGVTHDGRMSPQPLTIDVVVFDGVDELDAIGPLEVLRSAGLAARLVTRDERQAVTGANGLRFAPDAVYEPGAAAITLVTGGGWVARSERGAWGEAQRGDWLPLLAEGHRRGQVMAAVCTGTMLLAHAGVVGARRATTHHAAWDDLAATGATVVPERVVDDGDLVTSGGVTSGIDLALHLVARECSPELADQVAERIEHRRWQAAPVGG
jgi:transcriptional regulator GlxA family with amidase domain